METQPTKLREFQPEACEFKGWYPGAPKHTGLKFGIELELECDGLYAPIYDDESDEFLPCEDIPKGWRQMEEHSIQGIELVSTGPKEYHQAVQETLDLFEDIARQRFRLHRSCRGSTHYHVNCQDLEWNQLKRTVLACAWAEPILMELAGKGRRGNLFALSYFDSPLGWADIIRAVRLRQMDCFNDTHYMAVNFHSLLIHGTVEFRMPPSSQCADDVIKWLDRIKLIAEAGRGRGPYRVSAGPPPTWVRLLARDIPEGRREKVLAKCVEQVKEIYEQINAKIYRRIPPPFPWVLTPSTSLDQTITYPSNPFLDIGEF